MYASFVQDKFEYTQQIMYLQQRISIESNGYYAARACHSVGMWLGTCIIPFSVVLVKCAVYGSACMHLYSGLSSRRNIGRTQCPVHAMVTSGRQ